MSSKNPPKGPQTPTGTRTMHRWTRTEDRALLAYCDEHRIDLLSIGQPGGIPKNIFWGLIPGRLDLSVTPLACEMRYRTLTSDAAWARTRRGRGVASGPVPAESPAETTGDLIKSEVVAAARDAVAGEMRPFVAEMSGHLEKMTGLLEQLLDEWRPKSRARAGRPVANGHTARSDSDDDGHDS